MKRPQVRALQGLVLSLGSPLGWLLLRWLGGAPPLDELTAHAGLYAYMELGTAVVFTAFGWYVGLQEEHYRVSSLHDALTGLYNRRYFDERLDDERAFAARHRHSLALLVGDIDWFKKVNDTWGHATGDRVLAGVAGTLMALRRRGDTVARIGGEEFAVILPETDLAEALNVAERLRQAVAALRFDPPRGGPRWGVTVSFGVATCRAGWSATQLLEAADAAMYAAKQAGRNRVAAAGEGP